jgi:hypothetical protein
VGPIAATRQLARERIFKPERGNKSRKKSLLVLGRDVGVPGCLAWASVLSPGQNLQGER